MRLCILVVTFVPEKFHGPKVVFLSDHFFHEVDQ